MTWVEFFYSLSLVAYMNAMPYKLLVISTIVNMGLLLVKWWMR